MIVPHFYVLLTVHPCTILQINPKSAQFCLVYLFLFSTCFEQHCAHYQEKIAIFMRHWYLSICMGGVWSAGWSETPTNRPDATPPIQSDKYECRIDTAISSDDRHNVVRNM